jgi:hypothetical protein
LRGGVAPRHVRRYLAELDHHYDDLVAEERAHGVTGPAASAAAIERLGSTEQLAAALLAKKELRSVTSRYPWLLFGILPPLAVIASLVLLIIVSQLLVVRTGVYIPRLGFLSPAPAWLVWTYSGMMFAVNFLIVPLLGAVLAWTAQRQRIKPVWPLLGMALLLVLSVHGGFHVDGEGRVFRHVGILFLTWGWFGPGGNDYGPILLGQAALLCMPLAWSWRARHRPAAT